MNVNSSLKAKEAQLNKTKHKDVVALLEALYRTSLLTDKEEEVIFNMLFSRLLELDDFTYCSVQKVVKVSA